MALWISRSCFTKLRYNQSEAQLGTAMSGHTQALLICMKFPLYRKELL